MKILQVHNFYQHKGGEDQVCAAEYKLLTERGNQVSQFFLHNDSIQQISGPTLAVRTVWNNRSYRDIRSCIASTRPDIIHAHNTFPLVSPALYYAAAAQGVPVVQTLHNYRLLCPAATLFRDGRVCEECVGAGIPYPSVLHACYRCSRSATAVTAAMLIAHRLAGTWTTKVHRYVALTNFSKDKFVRGGLPAEKIVVKPNCLADDPGIGSGSGGYALFAGRLANDKGLRTLVEAWRRQSHEIYLKIAGDGPLSPWLHECVSSLPNVEWLGYCERSVILRLIRDAAFVIVPSESYENLPMVIIEAFACGTPVIASRLGSIGEIVQDGMNGLLFTPGDANHLNAQISLMVSDSNRSKAMREAARSTYEERYSARRNYILLMDLYNSAILTYKKASTLSL